MRVVVVGAGVIGAAVAFRLAQAGATVTVLESAERVGAGTSVRSFAWTNSNQKTPRAYHDLNVAGMTAHAALADEFGAIPWWHGGGSIDWCADDASRAEQAARVERLRSWGYAAKWISAAEVHELEPDLDLVQIGDAPIAFYPTEGWLDPIVYVHAMLTMARRHGASVRIGAHVEHVSVVRGRVQGVALRGGEHVGADVVVNCTGRWADTLGVVDTLDGGDAPGVVDSLDGGGAPGVVDSLDGGDALGVVDSLDGGDALGVVDSVNGGAAARAGGRALSLTLPLAPTLGLLVFTPPVASGLRRVVHAPSINMRPDGAGRLLLHADDADASLIPETAASTAPPMAEELAASTALPMARELVRRAATVLPGIGRVQPEAVRIGVRAIPADGLSAVGRMPGVDGYYVVVTHSGVTLSPFLARAVSEEILHGSAEPKLAPFRPDRLLGVLAR